MLIANNCICVSQQEANNHLASLTKYIIPYLESEYIFLKRINNAQKTQNEPKALLTHNFLCEFFFGCLQVPCAYD